MKKALIIVQLILISFISNAQFEDIYSAWDFKCAQKEVSIGDTVDLVFDVVLIPKFHIYSSYTEFGGATTFYFDKNDTYELIGDVKAEGDLHTVPGDYGTEMYFSDKCKFIQQIKILSKEPIIKGLRDYQLCDDKGCNPFFDVEFAFNCLTVIEKPIAKAEPKEEVIVKPEAKDTAKEEAKEIKTVKVEEKVKEEKTTENALQPWGGMVSTTKDTATAAISSTKEIDKPNLSFNEKVSKALTVDWSEIWSFMLIAFGAGLVALLTPCVFPMIPMTVTFFTSKGKSRRDGIFKAVMYGIFIIGIYTFFGAILAPFIGPGFANVMATHWIPNVAFFVIFLIFALSFFGLFEIVLPSKFVNNVDQKADKGGLIGVFFMAFTLVLVSFSCTGPIVGTIIFQSAGGEFLRPVLGMFAFASAFAIPFTLFAIFPEWLNSLPKSGGWLNSVKVVLGFVELALGLKFLSMADMAYGWGLLDRDVYLVLWIVIFTFMGFYLLGKIQLPHDSKVEKVSVARLMMSIATFSFVLYMIPGLFGAPLKGLAGYLPPKSTHDFDLVDIIRKNAGGSGNGITETVLCEEPKYSDVLHELPHGLEGYFDYEQALACAREQGKPLFVDFSGLSCVNCREMEDNVWSDPKVLKMLKKDFMVVALYVDSKTDLPEEEIFISKYDGKEKNTIGRKNMDFQVGRFHKPSQPYYVILDHNEEMIAQPTDYDKDISLFVDFLETGLKNFEGEKVWDGVSENE